MSSDEADKRIAALGRIVEEREGALADTRQRMDGMVQRIIAATLEFAQRWVAAVAEQTVIGHPEVAARAGSEGMRALKADLRLLDQNLPKYVTEELEADHVWLHRRKRIYDAERYRLPRTTLYGVKRVEGPIVEPVLRAFGRLGEVLAKHGFMEGSSDSSAWTREYRTPGPGWKFRELTEWPPEILAPLREYASAEGAFLTAYDALEKAKHERAQAVAKKLWDEE